MKLDNRIRLHCIKNVRPDLDIVDSFTVVVLKGNEGAAKNNYESMGYKVSVVNL